MPFHVHPDRTTLKDVRDDLLGLPDAPQDSLDPGEQLARGVRLGHVVVGADLQSDDLVDLTVLGREHDDRHGGLQAQRAADIDAGQPREHQVEQDEVGAMVVELGERVGPGLGDPDVIPLLAEEVGERVREGGLVLDEEDTAHGLTFPK
jgi:hypothetical protein